jgi:hypothetical protein
MLNYYADMYAANSPNYRGPAPVAFSPHSASQRRWAPALYAVSPRWFDLPALPEQLVAPPAYSAGQEQWQPAPNAAFQQFFDPQMGPARQAAPPACSTGQRQWTPAPNAASQQFFGSQMVPAHQVAAPTGEHELGTVRRPGLLGRRVAIFSAAGRSTGTSSQPEKLDSGSSRRLPGPRGPKHANSAPDRNSGTSTSSSQRSPRGLSGPRPHAASIAGGRTSSGHRPYGRRQLGGGSQHSRPSARWH